MAATPSPQRSPPMGRAAPPAPGAPSYSAAPPAHALLSRPPILPIEFVPTSSAEPTAPRLAENLKHKNHLQEYTSRCGLALPVYQTVNEGSAHAPHFRSSVTVNGQTFTSPNTFSRRKEAEQDVAKVALEAIKSTIKQEGCHLLREDSIFCKSILNEFAAKSNVPLPTYTTSQSEGLLPMFISVITFCGKTYTGSPSMTKKEAEQMAARTAIESILGDSTSSTAMSLVIKSKNKLFAALHKTNVTSVPQTNIVASSASDYTEAKGKDLQVQIETTASQTPITTASGPISGNVPQGECLFNYGFNGSGHLLPCPQQPVPFSAANDLPAVGSKKRRNRKKKKEDPQMKKLRTEEKLVAV